MGRKEKTILVTIIANVILIILYYIKKLYKKAAVSVMKQRLFL